MNIYKISEMEHKLLFAQEVTGDYLSGSIPTSNQNYYCSECGNPVDETGKNISKKKLSKWSFMNAKPIIGHCCNPY